MKWRVIVKGDKVRGSREYLIVDYKRSIDEKIIERRIKKHNEKLLRGKI